MSNRKRKTGGNPSGAAPVLPKVVKTRYTPGSRPKNEVLLPPTPPQVGDILRHKCLYTGAVFIYEVTEVLSDKRFSTKLIGIDKEPPQ